MPGWLCLVYLLAAAAAAWSDEKIMVLRPEGAHFEETARGLRQELGGEFRCEERLMGPKETVSGLEEAIRKARPRALVLMDNEAVRLYAGVQKQWRDSVPYPPSLALMAVRVDQAIQGLQRATGIFYEVPGVTIMVNLRSLLREPLLKVGVLYRPAMEGFVRENAKWCRSENIELILHAIPENGKDVSQAVKDGVKRLRKRDKVDALWILNDNFFLTPEIIGNGWLPALERFRKPVVVGVENFVTSRIRFGTFAILPDHYGLGAQAAGMIVRLEEAGWNFDGDSAVQQPLAIQKILNLKVARRYSRINDDLLKEIDRVVR
jgi:hypothetical protein